MARAAYLLPEENASCQTMRWCGGLPEESVGVRSREDNIAGAILATAREEAACLAGGRVVRMGVRIGEDCDIDLAALDHALLSLRCGTELDRVDIHLIPCPRRSLCHKCGCEFTANYCGQPCPQCASPNPELIAGDELEVAFIEVERP